MQRTILNKIVKYLESLGGEIEICEDHYKNATPETPPYQITVVLNLKHYKTYIAVNLIPMLYVEDENFYLNEPEYRRVNPNVKPVMEYCVKDIVFNNSYAYNVKTSFYSLRDNIINTPINEIAFQLKHYFKAYGGLMFNDFYDENYFQEK